MNSLLILAFVMALVGFVTALVTLYKMIFKKEAQRLPF